MGRCGVPDHARFEPHCNTSLGYETWVGRHRLEGKRTHGCTDPRSWIKRVMGGLFPAGGVGSVVVVLVKLRPASTTQKRRAEPLYPNEGTPTITTEPTPPPGVSCRSPD